MRSSPRDAHAHEVTPHDVALHKQDVVVDSCLRQAVLACQVHLRGIVQAGLSCTC